MVGVEVGVALGVAVDGLAVDVEAVDGGEVDGLVDRIGQTIVEEVVSGTIAKAIVGEAVGEQSARPLSAMQLTKQSVMLPA